MGIGGIVPQGSGRPKIVGNDSHRIKRAMTSFVQRRFDPGSLATLGKKWYNQDQISGVPIA